MRREPRILYVDGCVDACEIFTILMKRAGFEVISTHTAADAVAVASKTPFSLIISEYLLVDDDALNVLNKFKAADPIVPVVYYSTESRAEHKNRALGAGAAAFFVKPTDMEVLESSVKGLALV